MIAFTLSDRTILVNLPH